jgi:AhpD family alkylhydroperoxidase
MRASERSAARAVTPSSVRQSPIDPRLHELVKIRASQINGCAYCIDMHTRDALDGGETQRRLFALSGWRESPLFDDRERAALALTDGDADRDEARGDRPGLRGRRRALLARGADGAALRDRHDQHVEPARGHDDMVFEP